LILNCDQPGSEVTLTFRASPGAMLDDFPDHGQHTAMRTRDGDPIELGDAWHLHKCDREARCQLWSHELLPQ